eukprot:1391462-Alexandrium_andersonii.AAC.1
MSASLVGSEMCIRDRGNPGRRLLTTSQVPARHHLRLEHAAGRQAASRAVSYTHLTLPTICSV